jgi:hypothetical protein
VTEALSTSETSVNVYHSTRRSIPEDSHIRTRCCENLKSHHSPWSLLCQGAPRDPFNGLCQHGYLGAWAISRFPCYVCVTSEMITEEELLLSNPVSVLEPEVFTAQSQARQKATVTSFTLLPCRAVFSPFHVSTHRQRLQLKTGQHLCRWNIRFSWWWLWRWLFSEMLRRIVSYKFTDVSSWWWRE